MGDVTQPGDFPSGRWDLTSFTMGAHHLPDLETVSRVVKQMDRITQPEGLVMVMDVARLRTARFTEHYVKFMGRDHLKRGLKKLFEDFHHSMYAAWTTREFKTVVPPASTRRWCRLVPFGLPTVQILLGLPVGRKRVFIRPGFSAQENPLIREWAPRWAKENGLQWTKESLAEFSLLRWGLFL
ncbi:MAG: hypothetical protein HY211_05025 [Candidatus Omnitrophica bacterium]|nr:hypothetical protein [Candidatus Omnitrophota bacterium]